MRFGVLGAVAVLGLGGCFTVAGPTYRLYDGKRLAPGAVATIKVFRQFDRPGVVLLSVDSKHVFQYESMKGYPKGATEAARLDPETVELLPGEHVLRVAFYGIESHGRAVAGSTGQLIKMAFTGKEPPPSFASYRRSEDLAFQVAAGKTYLIDFAPWDRSSGLESVVFRVREVDPSGKAGEEIPVTSANGKSDALEGEAGSDWLMAL